MGQLLVTISREYNLIVSDLSPVHAILDCDLQAFESTSLFILCTN